MTNRFTEKLSRRDMALLRKMNGSPQISIKNIAQERDPNRLWVYHYSDNDAEVMHAAANRIYELTEWRK